MTTKTVLTTVDTGHDQVERLAGSLVRAMMKEREEIKAKVFDVGPDHVTAAVWNRARSRYKTLEDAIKALNHGDLLSSVDGKELFGWYSE